MSEYLELFVQRRIRQFADILHRRAYINKEIITADDVLAWREELGEIHRKLQMVENNELTLEYENVDVENLSVGDEVMCCSYSDSSYDSEIERVNLVLGRTYLVSGVHYTTVDRKNANITLKEIGEEILFRSSIFRNPL